LDHGGRGAEFVRGQRHHPALVAFGLLQSREGIAQALPGGTAFDQRFAQAAVDPGDIYRQQTSKEQQRKTGDCLGGNAIRRGHCIQETS